ncbi:MAG: hypothetical protein ABEJ86_05170 [Halococcoides sp.]
MSIDIGRVIGQAIERSLTTTGVVVAAMLFVIQAVTEFLSMTPALLESTIRSADQTTIGMIIGGLLFVWVVVFVASIAIQLVAARLLARPIPALATIERDAFTDRLLFGGGSLVVATLLGGLATALGFILFVVPGIYLAISFMFVPFAVAVEDRGPFDALDRSWRIAEGNRWQLFSLNVIFVVLISVISLPLAVVALIPIVGTFVSGAVLAAIQTVGLALLAEIYTTFTSGSADTDPDDPPWA